MFLETYLFNEVFIVGEGLLSLFNSISLLFHLLESSRFKHSTTKVVVLFYHCIAVLCIGPGLKLKSFHFNPLGIRLFSLYYFSRQPLIVLYSLDFLVHDRIILNGICCSTRSSCGELHILIY